MVTWARRIMKKVDMDGDVIGKRRSQKFSEISKRRG
jgi:hypothetical protein